MNTKEYIESGILEAFVLDALNDAERAEVASNIASYPELKAEVQAIEDSLILLADATSVAPPAHLQSEIWNVIQGGGNTFAQPVAIKDTKTIAFTPEASSKFSWARAAVWVALAGSALLNVMLWSQRNDIEQDRVALQQQMDTVKQQQQFLAGIMNHYHDEMEMMADSNIQTIVMKSIQPGHPMAATVYWNKAKGETYLAMKKLPMPPEGMQYQMWVIQDGKPVSMGVLSNDMVAFNTMSRLPMDITNGQAFAISLEKEGGSPTPTAENIYVLGKAS